MTNNQTHYIQLERTLEASPAEVFSAWTTPEVLRTWFAPQEYELPELTANVVPGGNWRICMISPKGEKYCMGGVYKEVVQPTTLSFTFAWEDENGNTQQETLVTVALEESQGKTLLTFRHEGLADTETTDRHKEGWSSCLDRLAKAV